MRRRMRRYLPIAVGVFLIASFPQLNMGLRQTVAQKQEPNLVRCMDQPDFTLRFYYVPPDSEHIRRPLILQTVEKTDARMGTTELVPDLGQVIFVSSGDMRAVVTRIMRLGLELHESPKPAVLRWEEFIQFCGNGASIEQTYRLAPKSGTPRQDSACVGKVDITRVMEITGSCHDGSATALIPAPKVCETLAQLDPMLTQPQAIRHLRLYRHNLGLGCTIQSPTPAE
jgi:hypothetical protein